MKCLVCQKEFQGEICPRCGFPVIESPNVDELIEQLKDQINNARREFENSIKLELITYHWKEEKGAVVPDRQERIPFGAYPALRGRDTWLSQPFARIPDAKSLQLRLLVTAREEEKELTVEIKNLTEPSLQYVGVEVDPAYRLRLKLKNDMGGSAASSWIEFV